MTALAANITDTQTLIPVDAGLTNGSFQLPLYYTVDSEAVRVTGRAHRTTWLVERGIAGTTAASHSSAATLTRYYPEAASSGAGAGAGVPDPTGAPDGQVPTTESGAYALTEPTTVLLTGGETEPGHLFRGPDAPEDTPEYLAILEAGDLWVDTTGGLPFQHKVWNGGQWDFPPMVIKDAGLELRKISFDPLTGGVEISAGPVDPDTGPTGPVSRIVLVNGLVRLEARDEVAILGAILINDDGSMELDTPWASLTVHSGGLEFGDFLAKPAGGIFLNLPEADPAEAGQLWSDTGVVKVSTG